MIIRKLSPHPPFLEDFPTPFPFHLRLDCKDSLGNNGEEGGDVGGMKGASAFEEDFFTVILLTTGLNFDLLRSKKNQNFISGRLSF